MTALLLAVGGASLLGSLHCAGMCGPLMLATTEIAPLGAKGATARPPRWAYHLGRALAYLALGIAAGSLGATIDLGGTMAGWGRIAAPLAAVAVTAFGWAAIHWATESSSPAPSPPSLFQRWLKGLAPKVAALSPRGRALGMGLLSALLPCGWLWAFVAVAAGTGSPLAGAAVMLVFWAGTVPALAALGYGARRFAVKWPMLRTASIAAVMLTGIAVAAERMTAEWRTGSAAKTGTNGQSAEDALAQAIEEPPPCCKP